MSVIVDLYQEFFSCVFNVLPYQLFYPWDGFICPSLGVYGDHDLIGKLALFCSLDDVFGVTKTGAFCISGCSVPGGIRAAGACRSECALSARHAVISGNRYLVAYAYLFPVPAPSRVSQVQYLREVHIKVRLTDDAVVAIMGFRWRVIRR